MYASRPSVRPRLRSRRVAGRFRRLRHGLWVLVLAWIGLWAVPWGVVWGQSAEGDARLLPDDSAHRPATGTASDPREPLPEILFQGERLPALPRGRSESQRDHGEAVARIVSARLNLNRQQYEAALQDCQRAWRWGQRPEPLLREIVSLCILLKRSDQAIRYATKAELARPTNPSLIRQLIRIAAAQDELEVAYQLHQRLHEVVGEEPKSRETVTDALDRGRLAFLLEHYREAIAGLEQVRAALDAPQQYQLSEADLKEFSKQQSAIDTLLGESLLKVEDWAQAERVFARQERNEGADWLSLQRARIQAGQGRWEQTRQLLAGYLKEISQPPAPVAWELYAKALAEKFPPDIATEKELQTLAQYTARFPKDAPLAYRLAERQLAAGRHAEAGETFGRAKALQPKLAAYLGLLDVAWQRDDPRLLWATLGEYAVATGDVAPLRSRLQRWTRAGTGGEAAGAGAEAAGALARGTARLRRAYGELDRWLSEAKGAAPDGAALAAALWAVQQGDVERALTYVPAARAADQPGDLAVTIWWGLAAYLADQPAAAVPAFERALQAEGLVAGQRREVLYYLSGALAGAGQYAAALKRARECVAENPEDLTVASLPAWTLYRSRRYDDAIAAFQKLLDTWGDDYQSAELRDAVRKARLGLAAVCSEANRHQRAADQLEQVLDEFPDDVQAHNDLGYLWANSGIHLERALELIRFAVAAEPENAAYQDSLGWAYYRLGRWDEAVRWLSRAAQGDADGVIQDHLGDALWKAGQRDRAVAAWTRAAAQLQAENRTELLERVREKLRKSSGS